MEVVETVGIDLGSDEGNPKGGEGRCQRCLRAEHRTRRGAGGQNSVAAYPVIAWLDPLATSDPPSQFVGRISVGCQVLSKNDGSGL